jgi:hypothetical protein
MARASVPRPGRARKPSALSGMGSLTIDLESKFVGVLPDDFAEIA